MKIKQKLSLFSTTSTHLKQTEALAEAKRVEFITNDLILIFYFIPHKINT